LIVLGDAVCSLNPVHGQGMSVAVQSCILLDQYINSQKTFLLHSNKQLTTQSFQRNLFKQVNVSWLMATAEDYRLPTTEGTMRSVKTKVVHWYVHKMINASSSDRGLYMRLMAVFHLIKPLRSLITPTMIRHIISDSNSNRSKKHV
jgi:flavin-dependent dehydrogenase